MLKIVLFVAAVLAIAAGQPSLPSILPTNVIRIGQLIQRVPTAVSHQSQTVVHNHANVVNDILAPVVRRVPLVTRVYPAPALQNYLGQLTSDGHLIYSIQN